MSPLLFFFGNCGWLMAITINFEYAKYVCIIYIYTYMCMYVYIYMYVYIIIYIR